MLRSKTERQRVLFMSVHQWAFDALPSPLWWVQDDNAGVQEKMLLAALLGTLAYQKKPYAIVRFPGGATVIDMDRREVIQCPDVQTARATLMMLHG